MKNLKHMVEMYFQCSLIVSPERSLRVIFVEGIWWCCGWVWVFWVWVEWFLDCWTYHDSEVVRASTSMWAGLSLSMETVSSLPHLESFGERSLNGPVYGLWRCVWRPSRRTKTNLAACRLPGTDNNGILCWEVGVGSNEPTWLWNCNWEVTSRVLILWLFLEGTKSTGTVSGDS